MSMINEFVEKLREKLGNYEYSHLVEHDTEECLHCRENEDDWCNCRNCFICVWDKAEAIVKELEEEYKDVPDTNVGKWIPVSEKLPDDYDNRFYMCIVENHEEDLPMFCQYTEDYGFGYWNDIYDEDSLGFLNSEFKTNDELGYEKVIAWQPLPEPYKGE